MRKHLHSLLRAVSALCLGAALCVLFASCGQNSNQEKQNAENNATGGGHPVLALQDGTEYDFGTVKEGEVVEKEFVFRNEGKSPLVISNITSSCGCTTPEWPREPVAPQAESAVLVRFNTKGKPGPQSKTVTISANTEPAVIELRIKGIVEGETK